MTSDKKPLSRKKRGYLLAILGGSFGGPFGLITSPLVLYFLNKTIKSKDGSQPNIFKLWSFIGLIGAPISLCLVLLLPIPEGTKKAESNKDFFVTK